MSMYTSARAEVPPRCAARTPDHGACGAGVGRALIAQARADLAAAGVDEAHLWVLAGNARAERFYARDGWTTDGTRRSDTVWGVTVDELAYRRRL